MAFLLPLLEGGAELLGEAGAGLLGEEVGGVAGDAIGSKVGKEIAGSTLSNVAGSLFGSFLPSEEEDKVTDHLTKTLRAREYKPGTIPVNKIYMTPKQIKNNESIPYQQVDENSQPIGWRLHYKEQKPEVGVIMVPKKDTYFPIRYNTAMPYRSSNIMFGNTGGF